jgi:hypothetical protein
MDRKIARGVLGCARIAEKAFIPAVVIPKAIPSGGTAS